MTKMKGFCSSNVLRTGVETTVLVVYAVTVCIVSLEVTVAWQLSMLEITRLLDFGLIFSEKYLFSQDK